MLIIVLLLILLLQSIYPFNFAKYNWYNNNKMAAVGVTLLTIISIVAPGILLIIRRG